MGKTKTEKLVNLVPLTFKGEYSEKVHDDIVTSCFNKFTEIQFNS